MQNLNQTPAIVNVLALAAVFFLSSANIASQVKSCRKKAVLTRFDGLKKTSQGDNLHILESYRTCGLC